VRRRSGVTIRDYRRVDEAGVALRQKRRQSKVKRGPTQLAAERRYAKSAKGIQRKARRRSLKSVVPLTAAEHQRIVALYAEAARLTAETGEAHHVDHDRPLALGGKHHPDNMHVVPAQVNLTKGAKYTSTWEFLTS
jgi:hypothetical protein